MLTLSYLELYMSPLAKPSRMKRNFTVRLGMLNKKFQDGRYFPWIRFFFNIFLNTITQETRDKVYGLEFIDIDSRQVLALFSRLLVTAFF